MNNAVHMHYSAVPARSAAQVGALQSLSVNDPASSVIVQCCEPLEQIILLLQQHLHFSQITLTCMCMLMVKNGGVHACVVISQLHTVMLSHR